MAEAVHPNLNLTPEEKRVFFQLFQAADTTNLGVITGELAVPFFEKTKLPPDTLGLIWQIADKENRGLLTPSGFSMVLRLIGHAQAGRAPTEELALQSGPIPRFDGIQVDTSVPSRPSTTSPPPIAPPAGGPGAPVRVPPLNPEDAAKFNSLFEKSDTPNGFMSGETAKQIFERARLPNEVLGRIWNLSDTKQRGQLDATDFIIAMHLLTSFKTGVMRVIPSTLPAGLYEAAARRGLTRTPTGPRVTPDVPPVPAIPTQFTGSQRTQSPLSRQPFTPLSAQSTGAEWLISPQEKAQFDNIFATVDTAKAGIISGDQAVTFFTNAQLPEDVLAQIWDLADIDADGQLTKDEFAVAMYLVRQQRGRKEPLPATLPPALIPPSMRRPELAPPRPMVPAAPPPPPVPVPRSAADDLFGLDAFSAPSPAPAPAPITPAQIPQSTGGSNAPPFQSPGSPSSRTSHQGPASSLFKPFIPSSQFGQSLGPQLTGAGATAKSPSPSDDLLGDNDPEETNKLTNETTELANLSNQIGSLSREMQNVQTKRATAEQDFTQSSQQKRDFEARLAQARSMYEKELKDFKALEERLNASRAETRKLQQDYSLIEASRQDLQNQYDQVSAALAADQTENASLKEKIRQANVIVSQLKPALDKARSDARQQKGLVAINKKQLATVEGERDKIQGEIDTLAREAQDSPEAARQVPASTGGITSPALSTTSQQTNPFFRRTATESSERAVSPPPPNPQATFDSLFGPSFDQPSTSTPPPPTSFGAASPFASQVLDAPQSSNNSGVPTPSVSPPPQTNFEPPALSQSRQMTPSFLPLEGNIQAPSTSTSTAVSPPASRFGAPEASEFGTPSRSDSVNPSVDNGTTENTDVAFPTTRSPFDEIRESLATTEESADSRGALHETEAPPISSLPGAFPEAPAESDKPAEGSLEKSKEESFDELFGNFTRQRSQSQKASDFDEAFAGMKPRSAEPAANGTGEFPPIREFDNDDDDDDDDSTDSEAQLGFDDNFTPASPPRNKEEHKNESIDSTQLQAFPVPGGSATPSQPPPPEAQRSPPSYNTSTADRKPDDFPPAFEGLLPSREDPTAAPDAPHSVESSTGAPIVAGEAQRKAGPADFDSAFAELNLAPAKEDDSEDEEEDETEAQTHRPQNDFDFSFDPPASTSQPAKPAAPNTAAADFFSFDDNVNTSANSQPAGAPQASAAGDHDWNALFAPLDNASKTPEGASNGNGTTTTIAPGASSKPPGWALTTDTGEDDLILKRLTGMGFPRDESLAALEKFDYNIDKAADYLTSRS